MEVLLLRLDAPLMSFGGVMVDQHGPTERFPGLSLLAGLFANALGFRHGDADKLEALQARLEYAARWDVEPKPLLDYHTVDLGPPKDVMPDKWFKMREPGWTTRGDPEHREGGTAKFGTHIRYRHYWANGVRTLAVTLDAVPPFAKGGAGGGSDRSHAPRLTFYTSPTEQETSSFRQGLPESRSHGGQLVAEQAFDSVNFQPAVSPPCGLGSGNPCRNDEENLYSTALGSGERGNEADNPNLQQLAEALNEPARPLFIGRKTCLPSSPLLLGLAEAEDVLAALRQTPPARRNGQTPPDKLQACWPFRLGLSAQSREVAVYDRRDWRNQIHAGRRLRIEGLLECPT